MAGTDADDDFEGQDAPPPAPEPKPGKFHARYVRDAEDLGISQADIDACANNAELRELVQYERQEKERIRATAPAREARRAGEEAGEGRKPEGRDAPPPPEVEADWDIEDPEGWIDERVKAELKKLGKAVKAAEKNGNVADEVAKLKKLVEAQQAAMDAQARRNHPLVRRGNAAVAQYKSLFGEEFDEDGRPADPESYERFNHQKLMRYLFGDGTEANPGHLDPKLSPEENVARAVKRLFGVASPGGGDEEPGPRPRNRVADWADAGQAPPTNRNGAARTGIPDKSGRDAREARRATGVDDPADDDDF